MTWFLFDYREPLVWFRGEGFPEAGDILGGFYGAFLRKIPVNSFVGDDVSVYRYAAVKVHIPDPFA